MGSAWLIYPETMCHTCVFSVANKNPPSRKLCASTRTRVLNNNAGKISCTITNDDVCKKTEVDIFKIAEIKPHPLNVTSETSPFCDFLQK